MPSLSELDKDFHQAIIAGRLEEVISLHKQGANIQAQEERNGKTALHLAVKHYHFTIAYYLLENGAMVDVKNNRNETPLGYAFCDTEEISEKIGLLLLKNGADVNVKFKGWPIISNIITLISYEKFDLTTLKLVLAKGAEINVQDADGDTPLHKASATLSYLLTLGKEAGKNALQTIEILLSAGADTSIKNKKDLIPLDRLNDFKPIQDYLKPAKKLLKKPPIIQPQSIDENESYHSIENLITDAKNAIATYNQRATLPAEISTTHRQRYETARLFWQNLDLQAKHQRQAASLPNPTDVNRMRRSR